MRSLRGNSILILESDLHYQQLIQERLHHRGALTTLAHTYHDAKLLLKEKGFDLVICNYYLGDAIISDLIEWIKKNLKLSPLIFCIGSPYSKGDGINQYYSLCAVVAKLHPDDMVEKICDLISGYDKLENSLYEFLYPQGLKSQLFFGEKKYLSQPIELGDDSVLLVSDVVVKIEGFAILQFVISIDGQYHKFNVPGFIKGDGLCSFRVNPLNRLTWDQFLIFLNERQEQINYFLKSVSGF
jgi:CheY-like chemotaxis protein